MVLVYFLAIQKCVEGARSIKLDLDSADNFLMKNRVPIWNEKICFALFNQELKKL